MAVFSSFPIRVLTSMIIPILINVLLLASAPLMEAQRRQHITSTTGKKKKGQGLGTGLTITSGKGICHSCCWASRVATVCV
ncbi:hypothetical protein CIPAW_10G055600 [Carya illinoinensis]|uniref:Uncharacterized protein n=1 Tax=Carya illinoinensis TaxID=32201 RepID=A0A8T1P7Y7_CARIL|nr:hypothetical protein CIPAW_10G055600 [Carya illinoinensis]